MCMKKKQASAILVCLSESCQFDCLGHDIT